MPPIITTNYSMGSDSDDTECQRSGTLCLLRRKPPEECPRHGTRGCYVPPMPSDDVVNRRTAGRPDCVPEQSLQNPTACRLNSFARRSIRAILQLERTKDLLQRKGRRYVLLCGDASCRLSLRGVTAFLNAASELDLHGKHGCASADSLLGLFLTAALRNSDLHARPLRGGERGSPHSGMLHRRNERPPGRVCLPVACPF